MGTKDNYENNPLADVISGVAKVTFGIFFMDAKEQAEQKRKERAENLRKLLLAGKRFRLDEMIALLNHQGNLQTIEQIADEVDLPVVLVARAVKRWFFF